MLNLSPQTPLAYALDIVHMAKPFMARLYRSYAEENNIAPWRPKEALLRITICKEEDATILSIPHQVADIRHTVLWRIRHDATLSPDGTLSIEVAFAATKPSQQTWHHARLHLTPTVELLE